MITLPLFRYDLYMYKKTLDVLYIASPQVREYVPDYYSLPLPPGGEWRPEVLERKKEKQAVQGGLKVFYVGNVTGGVYDLTAFCQAVSDSENVQLTICTPQKSWEEAKERYAPHLCDRIQVVHKSSDQLQPYYEEADVFCCCLEANDYTRLAMPIKTFEAISYGTPVMITDGIAAGDTVAKAGCGWKVSNDVQAFKDLLVFLRDHPEEIAEKTKNTIAAAPMHTWERRAQQVADELMNLKK